MIDQTQLAEDLSSKIKYESRQMFLVKPLEPVKVKKKKTGLIVTLVVLVAIIAAAVVLLITPVKSPLPIKFRCDDCNKIKYSEKYEVEYEDTGKVEERYICKDCFEENGYEEQ
mgnify:CR=1 FL=1